MRMPRLALLILLMAAAVAFARTTAAAQTPDYGKPQAWLCRRATVERAPLDPEAPVDCFYVYPTVSKDTTTVRIT